MRFVNQAESATSSRLLAFVASAAARNAQQPHQTEEMHRPCHVLQHETDGEDVEKDVHRPAEPVVRRTRWPRHVPDGNFRNPGSVETGEGRNEAMQLAVKVDVLDDLGAVGFECRPEIAEFHAGGLGHQPVRDS